MSQPRKHHDRKAARKRAQGPVRPPSALRLSRQPVLRYVDEDIVVVDKPAGLTTMRHPEEAAEFGARARRFLPPTLADLLPRMLEAREIASLADKRFRKRLARPARVIAVHRIDKDTSGLVVFARTPAAAQNLGAQFRAHSIERRYLALVRGQAKSERIESYLVRDRGDGRRGSSTLSPRSGEERREGEGQRAVTHVRVVEPLGDFTLVECRLETGRTHQVRIHLGERGTPLCGEHIYDRPLHGKPLPDTSGAGRPMLHATLLAITHPRSGQRMTWKAGLPADMQALLTQLRKRRHTTLG